MQRCSSMYLYFAPRCVYVSDNCLQMCVLRYSIFPGMVNACTLGKLYKWLPDISCEWKWHSFCLCPDRNVRLDHHCHDRLWDFKRSRFSAVIDSSRCSDHQSLSFVPQWYVCVSFRFWSFAHRQSGRKITLFLYILLGLETIAKFCLMAYITFFEGSECFTVFTAMISINHI